MIINIHYGEFNDKARKLFLKDRLNSFSIDYAYNSIMSWDGDEEITVFNFDKVCKMDNRYNTYEIYQSEWGVTLEILQ